MQHQDYWIKRFELLEAAQNDKGVEYYHNLTKQYNKAISSIEKDIAKWYARYATENEITLTEAKRLLNSRELAEFRMGVKEYIEKGESLDPQWAKQLEAASVRVHVSRLEALKIQMQQQAEMLYGYEKDGLDDLARRIYTDGYYQSAYEIQKGIGVGWDLMRLDANKINKVISKPWAADGRNFSGRLWTNKVQLVSELENTLTQSIMRGHAPKKAIAQIAARMKVSRTKAGRLVMTESAFFASAAQKDAFTDLDVEKFEIIATLDSRTSDTCRYLDGKVIPMKDYKPGVTAPPFHVWCRTTTAPYFGDEFTVNEQRAARDEDGKYYTVPASMKYHEWEKTFVDGGSKKGLELYNESKTIKASKTTQEQSKVATGSRSLNDVEKLNVDATEGLLDMYEARRRHFNLNMVPADELRGSKMNSVTADYTGVSVDTAKVFNDALTKLSKDYYSGLTRIEVADKKTMFGVSDFAIVSHNNAVGQKVLRLNPLKTNKLEELVNRIEVLSENGYAVRIAEGKAAEYVVTHEFAHSLIDMTSPLKNFVGIDVKQMKAIRKEIDDVFDAYKKDVLVLEKAVEEAAKNPILSDFGADVAEQMKAFQKMADAQKALKVVKLSEYSLKNADEFLAEAFTHSKIGIGKNKHAEKLMAVIDKHFKKKSNDLKAAAVKIKKEMTLQQASDEWWKKLTADEKGALSGYTSGDRMDVLEYHRKRGYFEDWKPTSAYDKEYKKELDELTKDMDSAIEKYGAIDKEVTLYRGVDFSFYNEEFGVSEDDFLDVAAMKKKMQDKIYLEKAYLSTTLDADEAFDMGNETALIRIRTKPTSKGAYLGEHSDIDDQKEFLFARNSKFKILDVIMETMETEYGKEERIIVIFEDVTR